MSGMKKLRFLPLLGLSLLIAGCASDPRPLPVTVPEPWSESDATPPDVPPEHEKVEVPDLAEGVRLFHEDVEVSMEALARGQVPEGSLIQVSVPSDARHTVVSDTLVQLHSMGFLVGIRTNPVPAEMPEEVSP